MAMFWSSKLMELEEKYLDGVEMKTDDTSFRLTLTKIPDAKTILHYKWIVTLSDGCEIRVGMGEDNISPERTRLNWIIKQLKECGKYDHSYLANSINDEIDKIYRKYR
ncbi:hypothetical protein [Bacillus badius]|uniref:hypothetical protein n=1 Tax=Bacillus badius TaxID=1455 RepID=UPI000596BF80|nr:hypothetical protein [Bacillus badius]